MELINLKLVKHNAQNARTSPEELVLQSAQVLAQRVTAKNVARLANILTQTPVSVDHVDTVSSSPTKVHSTAISADWVKQRDQPRLSQEVNAVTNARQECSLELMESVNLAQEELIAPKAFNQHVKLVPWDAPHQRSAQPPSKNAHCQFAHQEPTLMQQSTFALNAVKASINQSHNKLLAFPAHQTTAPRTLPPHQRLNAQTLAKLPLRVINIVIQMLIAFSFLKPPTSSVNVNLASTELARHAWVRIKD